jgi:hypothetical protein
MKKITCLSIILLSLILCSPVNAQKLKSFATKGVWELGGTIFYSSSTPVQNGTTGTATTTFQFQPVAGYFVANSIEIGLQPSFTSQSSAGFTVTNTGIYLAPAYNFILNNKIYPAVVALVGFTSTSFSSTGFPSYSASGFSWGGEAGVKMNLLGNSLLFVGLQYLQVTNNPSGSLNRSGQNVVTFGAGWNVFF